MQRLNGYDSVAGIGGFAADFPVNDLVVVRDETPPDGLPTSGGR